jgi:hypothetical protein
MSLNMGLVWECYYCSLLLTWLMGRELLLYLQFVNTSLGGGIFDRPWTTRINKQETIRLQSCKLFDYELVVVQNFDFEMKD